MFERKVLAKFGINQGSLLDSFKHPLNAKEAENNKAKPEKGYLVFGQALSQENFTRLYDSYFPLLYNYVSCRTANREEAEDIVGYVFEQVLSKFHTYNPQRGNLDGWIFTIARNAITDRQRYKKRHREQTLDEYQDLEGDISLSEQYLKQEQIQQLRHYLGRLSERERDLISLRYGADLSHRSIGELMKMSEGSVAVTLGRILRKLQSYFEAENARDQA